ncbi:hypothetical protein NX059_008426 [Plenodomus lindquistii]|nr:hypothetical protein NX059_008426 [Plenodomus lindquistii]
MPRTWPGLLLLGHAPNLLVVSGSAVSFKHWSVFVNFTVVVLIRRLFAQRRQMAYKAHAPKATVAAQGADLTRLRTDGNLLPPNRVLLFQGVTPDCLPLPLTLD